MRNDKRLPDAELEVMQAIWACEEPVKRAAISAILDRTHPMAPTTLLTVLSRLADKGFVRIEKTGRSAEYRPLVAKEDYLARQGRKFYDKLCGGSVSAFAAALSASGLTAEELAAQFAQAVKEDINPRDSWRAAKDFRMHIAVESAIEDLHLESAACNRAYAQEETLKELQTRQPEPVFPFRARVVVAGSEIDDPEFTKLLEMCGAMVVADRYCFGGFPGREEIEIREGEAAFDAICRHYLHHNQCVRFMDGGKIDQRHQELRRLVREYRADGVIYESMKFCEFWSYEKVLASHVLQQEMGIPCCTIEKEYNLGSVGQLRTRFQAFVESLEIKKLGTEKEGRL